MYRLYGSEMISCGLERPERLEEMGMRAKYPIVLGRMEEISAEAKLLIGEGRMNEADLVRRTDLPIKDAVNDGSEAVERETDETAEMTEWEEGPDQGTIRLALGCLIDCQPRWMAELRIQKAEGDDSVKSVIAIRDWRPADRVKVWSCLQKLAEEEGEENHRLDNLSTFDRRVTQNSKVAVVVHAVFLSKCSGWDCVRGLMVRVMDQMTNQIEGFVEQLMMFWYENLKS
ncbi:hypothetical protein BY996DRAFT_6614712 [Phakopsora pachyrhizi]|nr:hypothetical protein BY996DRAFT_6614712 [Phakopsora pachyrhizi]